MVAAHVASMRILNCLPAIDAQWLAVLAWALSLQECFGAAVPVFVPSLFSAMRFGMRVGGSREAAGLFRLRPGWGYGWAMCRWPSAGERKFGPRGVAMIRSG